MLLGARQFFEKRGAPTPPLPYDAEVEYIQSSGTQYIDTGIIPKSTVGAKILYALTDATQTDRCVLMDGGDNAGFRWGFSTRGGTVLQVSGINATGITWNNYATPLGISEVRYNFSNDKCCYLNGALIRESIPYGDAERTSTIWLNASYNSGVSSPWRVNYMRVYSLQITDNGVIVRDFVPVRVGTVGCLYDKISGVLYQGGGSSAFAAGPDVSNVEIGTSQYVQDGLVLMFDAIENAGLGKHSADANEWLDVFGKAGFSPQYGSCAFANGRAVLTGCVLRGCNGYFTPPLDNGLFTVQYVIPSATDERGYVFWRYGSSVTNPTIEIMRNGPYVNFSDHGENFRGTVAASDKVFESLVINGSSWSCVNTVGTATKTVSFTQKVFDPACNLALLGSAQGSSAYYFTGEACAIRIYNRALTADEIAANYAIDKARFNLP